MSSTRSRSVVVACFLLLAFLAAPITVYAQAWVPARGEGAVAVAFQSMLVTKHLNQTTRVDAGRIDTNVMLTDFTFGVTDKIAVDVAVPLVMARYTGSRPHAGTNIDDGTYRGSFTDVRFALRYNLTREGAVITPYIGSVVPSHDYAYYGHAAPGQRLRELQVGIYGAKLFESGLPGLFVSGRYGYGFVEKVVDISHNRSLADLEVGYFFSEKFRAFTTSHAQYTHGGVDLPPNGPPGLPEPLRPVHDVIQKVHALSLGAGAAYSISDDLDVFGSLTREVAGRNGHAMDRGITIGASWSFRRKQNTAETITASAPSSAAAAAAEPPAVETTTAKRSLVRCICQKSGT